MEPSTDNNYPMVPAYSAVLTAGCSLWLYFLSVLLLELMPPPPCFVLISCFLRTSDIGNNLSSQTYLNTGATLYKGWEHQGENPLGSEQKPASGSCHEIAGTWVLKDSSFCAVQLFCCPHDQMKVGRYREPHLLLRGRAQMRSQVLPGFLCLPPSENIRVSSIKSLDRENIFNSV